MIQSGKKTDHQRPEKTNRGDDTDWRPDHGLRDNAETNVAV